MHAFVLSNSSVCGCSHRGCFSRRGIGALGGRTAGDKFVCRGVHDKRALSAVTHHCHIAMGRLGQ